MQCRRSWQVSVFFLGGRQCIQYKPLTPVLLCEMTTVRVRLHQLVNVHFVSESNIRMKLLTFVLFMSRLYAAALTVWAPLKMDVYTISLKCVPVSLKSTLAGFPETLALLHHVAHVPELFVNPLASGTSCHSERRNKTVLLESATVWKTGGQLWGQRSNYTSERLIWVQLQRLSARQTDGGVQRERRAKAGRIGRGVDSWPRREKGWRSFSLDAAANTAATSPSTALDQQVAAAAARVLPLLQVFCVLPRHEWGLYAGILWEILLGHLWSSHIFLVRLVFLTVAISAIPGNISGSSLQLL